MRLDLEPDAAGGSVAQTLLANSPRGRVGVGEYGYRRVVDASATTSRSGDHVNHSFRHNEGGRLSSKAPRAPIDCRAPAIHARLNGTCQVRTGRPTFQ
jgi:hypothetical protein